MDGGEDGPAGPSLTSNSSLKIRLVGRVGWCNNKDISAPRPSTTTKGIMGGPGDQHSFLVFVEGSEGLCSRINKNVS